MNQLTAAIDDKVRPDHRDRLAVVYIRQSTPHQVEHHQESARLQYALVDYAMVLVPGACPQARRRPLSVPTVVPRVRSCRCEITLHPPGKSLFHDPESIQRTSSTASRCKCDSAALRTAGVVVVASESRSVA
jgi:hypothetical protein